MVIQLMAMGKSVSLERDVLLYGRPAQGLPWWSSD